MANNSVVTQEKLQEFYNTKVYPYLNGSANLGFTPIGTVISVMSNEAPDNYLVCDGTAYNISEYSDLADFFENQFGSKNYFGGNGTTTFAVPDLRGEFLRGTGTNGHTNQGNGASVGVHQDSTKIPYFQLENYTTPKMSFLALDSNHQTSYISNTDKILKGDTTRIDIKGSSSTTPEPYNSQSYTSRPTNTSVLYCIAYKDIYIDLALDSFPLGISNPTDGQALMYDATAGRWKNAGILHEYSTDEKIVGKWIDGKPIYEKTIVIQSNFTTPFEVASNIDKLINVRAFRDNTNANSIFPYLPNSVENYNAFVISGYFNKTDKMWRPQIGSSIVDATTAIYYTFQYTKTTD